MKPIKCDKCQDTGVVWIDVSAMGGDDWNPGYTRIRCECNPMTPEELERLQKDLAELGIDTDYSS